MKRKILLLRMLAIRRRGLTAGLAGLALSLQAGSGFAMDLLDSYKAALANDANYLAAQASAQADSEALPQAQSQLMPSLALSYSRTKLNSVSDSYVSPSNPSSHLNYFSDNRALTLRQPIYRKSLVANYAQAQSNVKASMENLKREEQDLSVRVISAYFDVLLSQEQMQLIKVQMQSATVQLLAAKASYSKGVGTRTDVDEVQARLDVILADEYAAKQQIDYALEALKTLTNQPVDHLSGLKIFDFETDRTEFGSLEHWVMRAMQESPVVLGMQHKLDAAIQEVEKASAGHTPTVDLVAQMSQSLGENAISPSNDYRNKSLGVQVNIPLFAGGYYQSTTRQALANKDKAEQQLEATRRSVGLQVQKEHKNVTSGLMRVKALEQAVRSGEQSVYSNNKSLEAGIRSRLNVLEAEQKLAQSRRDLTEARFNYLIAKVKIYSLVGAADEVVISKVNALLDSN